MNHRLLAVDLDGTLLRHDGTIHDDDLAAMRRLQAAGVPISIVTGRLYSGTRKVARAAGLGGPLACVDGSHIVDSSTDATLFDRSIGQGHALLARDIFARADLASFLFARDSIVHDGRGGEYVAYVRTWSPDVEVVERVVDHPSWQHPDGILAVVAVGTEPMVNRVAAELGAELAGAAQVVSFSVKRFSGTSALILRAAGATKGTAVDWLAAHHGCQPSEVVAVGDWYNDVPMFQRAGRSFVMAQAPENVKLVATDRLSADVLAGGGVAEAIGAAWGL